jgi:hypothetical protein
VAYPFGANGALCRQDCNRTLKSGSSRACQTMVDSYLAIVRSRGVD